MKLPEHLERILDRDYRNPITSQRYLSEEDLSLMLPEIEKSIRRIENQYKTLDNR